MKSSTWVHITRGQYVGYSGVLTARRSVKQWRGKTIYWEKIKDDESIVKVEVRKQNMRTGDFHFYYVDAVLPNDAFIKQQLEMPLEGGICHTAAS